MLALNVDVVWMESKCWLCPNAAIMASIDFAPRRPSTTITRLPIITLSYPPVECPLCFFKQFAPRLDCLFTLLQLRLLLFLPLGLGNNNCTIRATPSLKRASRHKLVRARFALLWPARKGFHSTTSTVPLISTGTSL